MEHVGYGGFFEDIAGERTPILRRIVAGRGYGEPPLASIYVPVKLGVPVGSINDGHGGGWPDWMLHLVVTFLTGNSYQFQYVGRPVPWWSLGEVLLAAHPALKGHQEFNDLAPRETVVPVAHTPSQYAEPWRWPIVADWLEEHGCYWGAEEVRRRLKEDDALERAASAAAALNTSINFPWPRLPPQPLKLSSWLDITRAEMLMRTPPLEPRFFIYPDV